MVDHLMHGHMCQQIGLRPRGWRCPCGGLLFGLGLHNLHRITFTPMSLVAAVRVCRVLETLAGHLGLCILTFSLSVLLASPESLAAITTPAPVPANQVNLADFGGVPGASSATIINAFNQAFTKLKSLGGGTLFVTPGVYDLGSFTTNATAVRIADLQNVIVSAYGAHLTITTNTETRVYPVFFRFLNPNNVTIVGMSFRDFGLDLVVKRKGALCLVVETTRPCSGFKTVDAVAENVLAFLSSEQSSHQYTLQGFDIHATVRNSYYGVNVNYNGRFSKANITAHNTRRAFISYGARDWDVTVHGSADGVALGSNAFVELVPDGTSPVENVNVNLTMTGDVRAYSGLVHFYNQGPLTAPSYTRNVKANVVLNNVTGSSDMFIFDHEYPVRTINSSSPHTYEQVTLTGSIVGTYAGTIISNPTISTGSTNSIKVASTLASHQNMSALPSYFQVFTPTTTSPAPAPAPTPTVSLAIQGAPNLPLNGTSTTVTVGFVTGTPTKVELSRDGYAPFATWPSDTFFSLSADGKSLSGNWCISSSCWGGISGSHVLNVVATYASGATAKASVNLNVLDSTISPATSPAPDTGVRINMALVQHEIGNAYIITQNFRTPADTSAAPTQSKLQIYENGKALGPAHSLHADIRNIGKGRFSHWQRSSGASLRFSTSDNSDPRTNGRTYTYQILP